MSTDSLCTDSLQSDIIIDANVKLRSDETHSKINKGKENNVSGERKSYNSTCHFKSKSTSNSPITKRLNTEKNRATAGRSNSKSVQNFIISTSKSSFEQPGKICSGNNKKMANGGKIPVSSNKLKTGGDLLKSNVSQSNKGTSKTLSKTNQNYVNGNSIHGREDMVVVVVDSENNEKRENFETPSALSRSGTFLKGEPTILKKLPVETSSNGEA